MTSPELTRTTVDSSVLLSVAYSSDSTLELVFTSGAVYHYFSVPRVVLDGLLAAVSKGAYFNRNVRARFRHQRVA